MFQGFLEKIRTWVLSDVPGVFGKNFARFKTSNFIETPPPRFELGSPPYSKSRILFANSEVFQLLRQVCIEMHRPILSSRLITSLLFWEENLHLNLEISNSNLTSFVLRGWHTWPLYYGGFIDTLSKKMRYLNFIICTQLSLV